MTTYHTEIRVSGGFYTIKVIFNADRLMMEYYSIYMGTDPKDFLIECSYENFSPDHGWLRVLSIKDKEGQLLYSWAEEESSSKGSVGILFEYFVFPQSKIHLINDLLMEEMRSMGSVSHNPTFDLLILGFETYKYDPDYEEFQGLLKAPQISKFAKVEI